MVNDVKALLFPETIIKTVALFSQEICGVVKVLELPVTLKIILQSSCPLTIPLVKVFVVPVSVILIQELPLGVAEPT